MRPHPSSLRGAKSKVDELGSFFQRFHENLWFSRGTINLRPFSFKHTLRDIRLFNVFVQESETAQDETEDCGMDETDELYR